MKLTRDFAVIAGSWGSLILVVKFPALFLLALLLASLLIAVKKRVAA